MNTNTITTPVKLTALCMISVIAISVALLFHKNGTNSPAAATNQLLHAFATFQRTSDTESAAAPNRTDEKAANDSGLSQTSGLLNPTVGPTRVPTTKPITNKSVVTRTTPTPTQNAKKGAVVAKKPTPTLTKKQSATKPATYEQVPYVTDSNNTSFGAQPPQTGAGRSMTYVVQCGDTLGSIAYAFYADASKAQTIYDANARILGDINNIACDVEIRIP